MPRSPIKYQKGSETKCNSISSHLMSLESLLEKYQEENTILVKKVEQLTEENERLKQGQLMLLEKYTDAKNSQQNNLNNQLQTVVECQNCKSKGTQLHNENNDLKTPRHKIEYSYSTQRNQILESDNYPRKNLNPSERSMNPHERLMNHNERNSNFNEISMNPLERSTNPHERTINHQERSLNPLERSLNPPSRESQEQTPLERSLGRMHKLQSTMVNSSFGTNFEECLHEFSQGHLNYGQNPQVKNRENKKEKNSNDEKTERKHYGGNNERRVGDYCVNAQGREFRKEVYLEADTFCEESYEDRLPTFSLEPFFGEKNGGSSEENLKIDKIDKKEEKNCCHNCQNNCGHHDLTFVKVGKSKTSTFTSIGLDRLDISQKEKEEILREKQKFMEEQRKRDQENLKLELSRRQEKIEVLSGKKTNFPYIESDDLKISHRKKDHFLIHNEENEWEGKDDKIEEPRETRKNEKYLEKSPKKNRKNSANKIHKTVKLR